MSDKTAAVILKQSKLLSPQIKTDEDAIAKLALLHPNAALDITLTGFSAGKASLVLSKRSDVFQGAKKAFEEAKKLVEKIVCRTLKYCDSRDSAGKWLDTHLPEIVSLLLKGAPTGTIARILKLLGISAGSWAAVVAIIVAWLIKVSLDTLCDC